MTRLRAETIPPGLEHLFTDVETGRTSGAAGMSDGLHERGVITADERAAARAKILGG